MYWQEREMACYCYTDRKAICMMNNWKKLWSDRQEVAFMKRTLFMILLIVSFLGASFYVMVSSLF